MSTILDPSTDLYIGSGWSKNGFSGSYSGALSLFNNSEYGSVNSDEGAGSSPDGSLQMTLAAIPGNVVSMSAASISLDCCVNSTKSQSYIYVKVYNSSGSTVLAGGASGAYLVYTPTTSFATSSLSCSTFVTTISSWTNAYIQISTGADGRNNTLEVCGVQVVLTVTLASTDGGTGGSGEDSSWMFGSLIHRGAQLIAY